MPIWIDATNWNARRYFHKGVCAGAFEDIDEPDMHQPGDDRKKYIVCGRIWTDTNYHELLMYLVTEMTISTGGYTTDREYFKTKCEGLYDAPCLQLRTNEEDVIQESTNPRNNKTKSKIT